MRVPLMIDAAFLRPVIIGCGPVARMKARTLCRYGVRCRMVGPEPPVWETVPQPEPLWTAGLYEAEQLAGANLVIAATADEALNARICEEAGQIGIAAVNVSQGSLGTASLPRAASLGDITLTVATEGASPAAGERILAELTQQLEQAQWPQRIALLKEMRQRLKTQVPDRQRRQMLLRELAALSLEDLLQRRSLYED